MKTTEGKARELRKIQENKYTKVDTMVGDVVKKILGNKKRMGNLNLHMSKREGKEFLDKPVHEATESVEEEKMEHKKRK